jgi:spore cortex formation protein SpoVR/YcgB (stage V sporulation)
MNEGWATFWHYTLLNHLYDEGLLADSFMLEFLQSHTNVVAQPPYNSRWFGGLNPYALGFAMWRDIRRICERSGRRGPALVPRDRRQRLAGDLRLRDAQLQGRELRRAVPVAEA